MSSAIACTELSNGTHASARPVSSRTTARSAKGGAETAALLGNRGRRRANLSEPPRELLVDAVLERHHPADVGLAGGPAQQVTDGLAQGLALLPAQHGG